MDITDLILKELYKGEVSGEKLAEKFGVTRTSIWKYIKKLEQMGYEIVSTTNRGYFLKENNILSAGAVMHYLNSEWELEFYPEVTSTNDIAKVAAHNGKNNFAVVADSQSAGRGRLGRAFVSPKGVGVYVSALVRPDINVTESGLVTAYAALIVAEAIEELSGLKAEIKWVNDVYINGRKVCGILTEGGVGMEGGLLDYVVAGIGVNVLSQEFPPELKDIATTIEDECGIKINRNALAAKLLDKMSVMNERIHSPQFVDDYRSKSFIIGKEVLVNGEYVATVKGIADDCSLILDKGGKTISFSIGEVSLKLK